MMNELDLGNIKDLIMFEDQFLILELYLFYSIDQLYLKLKVAKFTDPRDFSVRSCSNRLYLFGSTVVEWSPLSSKLKSLI